MWGVEEARVSLSPPQAAMPKVSRKEQAAPLAEIPMEQDLPEKPSFSPLAGGEDGQKMQFRRIPVPQHRMTPLKASWMQLYEPITKNLKLDMRMNLKTKKVSRRAAWRMRMCAEQRSHRTIRQVEIKTTASTPNNDMLQKAADFVHAYILGFEVRDAIALLRMDDLYVEGFEIKDVKVG